MTKNQEIPTITISAILLAKFDGQVLVPFTEAIKAIGYNEQTARNQLANRTFPIPTVLQGNRRRYIMLPDLIAYGEAISAKRQLPKAKIGRPTKVEQVDRRSA